MRCFFVLRYNGKLSVLYPSLPSIKTEDLRGGGPSEEKGTWKHINSNVIVCLSLSREATRCRFLLRYHGNGPTPSGTKTQEGGSARPSEKGGATQSKNQCQHT